MKKVLFTATVDSHILHFHIPFLKLFKDNGYEVHVATNGSEKIPYCDVKHVISFERSPFKLNNIKAIKELKKIINTEKYDIIHCHTPMGGVVTRLAAKQSRKENNTRVIYTAHGFHFYKGAPLINWLLFYPVEWFLAKYTDTLITINQEDSNLAKKRFSKRCNNIEYVPGVGIDENKFNFKMTKKEKSALRKELGLKDDDFVMIYPAELSKRKRQIWMIKTISDLLKEHEDIHLLLPGNDSLNGKCQTLVNRLNLNDQIHILGYRKDIPKLLKISNLALSSSKQEGLPVNLMEAMIIGLPIIATDCRGNMDLIKNVEGNYLIKSEDFIGFINTVKKIYNKRVLSNKVKTNIEEYLLNAVINKMEDIYNKKEIVLIIPNCTDLNRGDQALVLETKKVIDAVIPNNVCYMMSNGEATQCSMFGVNTFSDILKHPSRFSRKNSNLKYSFILKIKWGIVAIFDFLYSNLLLFSLTRKICLFFLPGEVKQSISLYNKSNYIFVKGGGFLHDYNKGLVGYYTIYYQLYHIKLALKMKKKVFIMPNSYGPFNIITSKMVRKVLSKCEMISARESLSAHKNSNGLGIDIDLFPDLAFFLDKNQSKLDINKLMNKNNINLKKDSLIAITVRPYRFYSSSNPDKKYEEYKQSFIDLINYVTSTKYKVLLVVHTRAESDHENDEKCIDEILSCLINNNKVIKIKDDNYNCYDLKKIYGCCEFVIGTRFHSVIFSLEQLIPCIAITYGGNKGDGIMKDIGLSEYSIKIENLSSNKLIELFNTLNTNKNSVKTKIKKYLRLSNNKYLSMIDTIKERVKQ